MLVVGIGGTLREQSSSELALRCALSAAEIVGARCEIFTGAALEFAMYDPQQQARSEKATRFIEAVRNCDGIIVASPGYHGSISGLVKNALDYVEDLREDERPYFDGRAVGCIACAYGWQAAGSTLSTLRAIVHALRGWPTPLGAMVNSAEVSFHSDGVCSDEKVTSTLRMMGEQVVRFALMQGVRRRQRVGQ